MTLGILSTEARRNPNSWKVLSYLLDDDAESNSQENQPSPKDKIQNLHNQIAIALKELQDLHESGDSIQWNLEYGGDTYDVEIKFVISYVVSDSEMHNKLCGTYRSFGVLSNCPCRMCDIKGEHLIDPEMFKCSNLYVPETFDHKESYYRDDAHFQMYSQHRIENAWYKLPWGANINNIHGGATPETLHVVELGAQRCVESLEYTVKKAPTIYFEPNLKVAKNGSAQGKSSHHILQITSPLSQPVSCLVLSLSVHTVGQAIEKLEYLGKRIGVHLTRQSERDKPRTVFGNDLFSNTKKFTREQAGVVLCFLLVMLSDRGRRILVEERGIHNKFLQKMICQFELCLQLENWLKKKEYPSLHAHDKARMGKQIDKVITLIGETCAREGNGALLYKNHLPFHFPHLITEFGPPSGFNSAPIEAFHKMISGSNANGVGLWSAVYNVR